MLCESGEGDPLSPFNIVMQNATLSHVQDQGS